LLPIQFPVRTCNPEHLSMPRDSIVTDAPLIRQAGTHALSSGNLGGRASPLLIEIAPLLNSIVFLPTTSLMLANAVSTQRCNRRVPSPTLIRVLEVAEG
jgi:hypothetical protein